MNKVLRRLLLVAVSAFILFAPVGARAEEYDWSKEHPAYLTDEEISQLSDADREAYLEHIVYSMGYIAPEGDNTDCFSGTLSDLDVEELDGASYAKKYDPRGTSVLPAVRNQGKYGTCWAHAAMACMEIDLIKNHGVSNTIDLSELQLAYFAFNAAGTDPRGGLSGTSYKYKKNVSSSDFLNMGGNFILSSNVLTAWQGAADENQNPRLAYTNASPSIKLTSKDAYDNNFAHLAGYATLGNPSRKTIKGLIKKYGAVQVSYYGDSYGFYYGQNNTNFYCPYKLGTTHAVTIVGWDDSYSKKNFRYTPSGNGAWIVRNSWGDYWGANGYFYLSYYDKTATNYSVFDAVKASDDAKNNYQYAQSPFYDIEYSSYGAAIFTANTGASEETLRAVSLGYYINSGSGSYSYKVYAGCSADNPTSGRLIASGSGTVKDSGTGDIKIKTSANSKIKKGEKFSVVVQTGGSLYLKKETSYNLWGAYSGIKISKKNSYTSYSGSYWSKASSDLQLRAFTDGGNGGSSKPSSKLKAPKATKIKSISSKSKKVTVKFAKSSKANGYQIMYGTKSNFKGAKKVSVKKTSYTTKALSKGKTYYFKVRAYAKSGKTTKYSKWSGTKKIKVK